MDYTNQQEIAKKARQIAPLTEEDLQKLGDLLEGIKDSTELLEDLMLPFDSQITVSDLSGTVDGQR